MSALKENAGGLQPCREPKDQSISSEKERSFTQRGPLLGQMVECGRGEKVVYKLRTFLLALGLQVSFGSGSMSVWFEICQAEDGERHWLLVAAIAVVVSLEERRRGKKGERVAASRAALGTHRRDRLNEEGCCEGCEPQLPFFLLYYHSYLNLRA